MSEPVVYEIYDKITKRRLNEAIYESEHEAFRVMEASLRRPEKAKEFRVQAVRFVPAERPPRAEAEQLLAEALCPSPNLRGRPHNCDPRARELVDALISRGWLRVAEEGEQ